VSTLRPNVAALLRGDDSDDDGAASGSEEEDFGASSRSRKGGADSGVYRPPKAHAVPYMVRKYVSLLCYGY
jgi:hypothetical protein